LRELLTLSLGKKAFIVQAGREIRILVNPDELSEEAAMKTAKMYQNDRRFFSISRHN